MVRVWVRVRVLGHREHAERQGRVRLLRRRLLRRGPPGKGEVQGEGGVRVRVRVGVRAIVRVRVRISVLRRGPPAVGIVARV